MSPRWSGPRNQSRACGSADSWPSPSYARSRRRATCSAAGELGAGDLRRLVVADVGGEGELDQIGEQRLELVGLAGDDATRDQRDHAADEGFLGRVGEAGEDGLRPALAARLEVGQEGLHGGVVA